MTFGKWAMGFEEWAVASNRYPPHKGHCHPPQNVLLAYRGRLKLFHFQDGRCKEEERLGSMGSFVNMGSKLCRSGTSSSQRSPLSASQKSPSSDAQGKVELCSSRTDSDHQRVFLATVLTVMFIPCSPTGIG